MLRALDLFCGAGGATKGLQRAGFHVTGVDIKPQPHYCGDHFIQGDAVELAGILDDYAFIWASPPCQHYSQCTPKAYRGNHPDMIGHVRDMLRSASNRNPRGVPYCIENVPSAAKHLQQPLMLCGSMFGLKIQRHRFFEVDGFFAFTPQCRHTEPPVLITGTHRRTYEPRYEYTAQQCRDASGLHWMTRREMDEAIPPAYSEFIGKAALQFIRREAA